MKKIYLHVYLVFALLVATFIVGSFFDYQINDALFSNKDTFGLVISVIGTIPGYGVLAFLGGGLVYLGIKREYPHKFWKYFNVGFGILSFGLSVYFIGKEFFGPNGFDYLNINPLFGLLIALPVDAAIGFLGYKITCKTNNDKLWLIYIILALAIGVALIGGVTLLKSIFHRPRFRSLGTVSGLEYHNWWSVCSDYKTFINDYGVLSEEFKSFPSGHAGTCGVFLMSTLFLPYIDKKYEKISYVLFGCGFVWTLLVSFARMRVGAHFLSDVSMGALLSIIFIFIAKVVIDNVKYFSHSDKNES